MADLDDDDEEEEEEEKGAEKDRSSDGVSVGEWTLSDNIDWTSF